ncbi:hypothetical protein [Streptococcus australis]|uniref:hypothetical protein n=1 Tax=Streptococcus australis TaxID=113107 RepID=UPI00232ED1C8|nr:hypothetical protein [Streptococcus australis]MDB8642752.1 hypothetical protein [Streptococcus australis]MDB8645894.1 hypothetical protein [Streptococcus australis]
MFFREVIYIGESQGQAIYVHVNEPRNPLAAPKSKLLNTDAARGNRKHIILSICTLLAVSSILQFFPATRFFTGVYSYGTLIYFLLTWLLEVILLLVIVERALYKNVSLAEPTSKENFRRAVNSNLFWNNFSDKKVTLGKKLFAWIFTVFIAVMGLVGPISVLSMLVLKMMGTPIGSEIFPLSLMGILPAVAALLLWQNNMIQWLKAVERYRNHRIKKEIE